VRFNAWHYSETNLWASLVDRVLQEVLLTKGLHIKVEEPPEVKKAEELASEASANVRSTKVDVAEQRLRLARESRLDWLVRNLWAVMLCAILVITVTGLLLALTQTGRVVWFWITGAVSAMGAVLLVVKAASGMGHDAFASMQRLREWHEKRVGAVKGAARDLRAAERSLEAAEAQENHLSRAAVRAKEMATSTDLGAVLARLSGESEYRDQLSFVTRTRERFGRIDEAVRKSRRQREEAVLPVSAEQLHNGNAMLDPQAGLLSTNEQEVGHASGSLERPGKVPDPAAPGTRDAKASPPDEDPEAMATEVLLDRVVIVIDDLDRCPPEKVVSVLEAVHLLFDFEMFVVVLAVDTRWLEQSLKIRYRKLLGKGATASPADYLEKIIQIPLHLVPLDRSRVISMLHGLTGAASRGSENRARGTESHRNEVLEIPSVHRASLIGKASRPPSASLPPRPLDITDSEVEAMAEVSPLMGSTPRTVKRFVNTYRLLKARAFDPVAFDDLRDELGDHQVVAFLLALVTGHPDFAALLIEGLVRTQGARTLEEVVQGVASSGPSTPVGFSKEVVIAWLTGKRLYAKTKSARFTYWAVEVGRFSFLPPIALLQRSDAAPSNS
jgi:hypothetical protein